MIVVDASVVLEVVLRTPAASRVMARLAEAAETLHAPHLIDLEVAQVVRRFCATRESSDERGESRSIGNTISWLVSREVSILISLIKARRTPYINYKSLKIFLVVSIIFDEKFSKS